MFRVVVSEMNYTVSSGTLNSTIPYHTLRPSHVAWGVSLPVSGSYRLQPPLPFISIIDVREDCVEWWNVILLLHKRVLYARIMHAVFSTAVCVTKFY